MARKRNGQEPEVAATITVNLTRRSVEALDHTVQLTTLTKTDAVNRAIQVYDFIEEELQNCGEFFVRYPDGTTRKVTLQFGGLRVIDGGA